MFGISTTELIFILFIGLIVVGPKKLPKMARSIGKMLAQFRSAIDSAGAFEEEAEEEEEGL
ncbi:MAG: twin-arginine translocase TatA/TatE family subunit [Kiritimatiellae bacterium]|nr:twin-arginine translocase TatA/TatE family subunit [Kiritimatiellia bacterium]